MTKVSVIIPAYNQAQFLAQAIQSVLDQTHEDIEIVVINDGSTDNTKEVLESFLQYANVKAINQENVGLAEARNRGIRESTGEYLCFLDSDDYLEIDKIRNQADILNQEGEFDFIYCDISTVNESGELIDDGYSVGKSRSKLCGNIFQSLILGGYFPPHTVLVRRKSLDKVGWFDPTLGGHADYDLWLRLSASGSQAYYLDRKLVFYREHSTGMSKNWAHMNATRKIALVKIAAQYPKMVGEAINTLILTNEELFKGNQWLKNNWQENLDQMTEMQRVSDELYKGNQWLNEQLKTTESVIRELKDKIRIQQVDGNLTASGEIYERQFSFADGIGLSRLLEGNEDQKAVWEVTLNNQVSKAIFLHPPAKLEFRVPVGGEGSLSFAICLHPDVWENPQSGSCVFNLTVDDRIVLSNLIDPVHIPEDRTWHYFSLPVQTSLSEEHVFIIETDSVGGETGYRWALWKDPVFHFDPKS